MKKLLFIVTVAVLALMSEAAFALDVDLLAGQTMDIGTVRITNDGDSLQVEYIIDEACGWGMGGTHLHVSTTQPTAGKHDEPDIPQNNKGNPQIGNFDWTGAMSYDIPFADIGPGAISDGTTVYVAAHAGGQSWDALESSLPTEPFTLSVDCGYGVNHYLDIEISDDGVLDGLHGAWCVDVEEDIFLCSEYQAEVMFSAIPVPSYLDWLLNNYMSYLGETSGQPDGSVYVLGDVQAAIWLMIGGMPTYEYPDDPLTDQYWSPWAWGLSTWGDWADANGVGPTPTLYDKTEYDIDVARAQELVDDAMLYGGEGYNPGCCGVTGIILLPTEITDGPAEEGPFQPIVITVPAPCDETAWGEGIQFPVKGKGDGSWAMYIPYVIEIADGD